jgi:hypothetical protein
MPVPSGGRATSAVIRNSRLRADWAPRKPHMSQDARCRYCGLLVRAPHENDAACVAALKAAITDARRVSSTCEVVHLERPRVSDDVADDEKGIA